MPADPVKEEAFVVFEYELSMHDLQLTPEATEIVLRLKTGPMRTEDIVDVKDLFFAILERDRQRTKEIVVAAVQDVLEKPRGRGGPAR